MKHTPGPWMIHDMEERVVVTVSKKPSICIADTAAIGTPLEVNRANARLIAAAPELLEALRETKEWIDNWSPNFCDDEEWDETKIKVDGAIAKATAS